jgi:hypothetical protein
MKTTSGLNEGSKAVVGTGSVKGDKMFRISYDDQRPGTTRGLRPYKAVKTLVKDPDWQLTRKT